MFQECYAIAQRASHSRGSLLWYQRTSRTPDGTSSWLGCGDGQLLVARRRAICVEPPSVDPSAACPWGVREGNLPRPRHPAGIQWRSHALPVGQRPTAPQDICRKPGTGEIVASAAMRMTVSTHGGALRQDPSTVMRFHAGAHILVAATVAPAASIAARLVSG